MRAKLGIVEGVCNTHLRCIPAILRPPDEVQKTPRNVMTEQELLYGWIHSPLARQSYAQWEYKHKRKKSLCSNKRPNMLPCIGSKVNL